MWSKIARFIELHHLLDLEKTQLVAVSGGADSVALLLVLAQLGYKVEAVHCNFHLRGDESLRDEQFVIDLCRRHHIALHRAHFDTQSYAQLHKQSIEMAARNLRYAYFEELRKELDAENICVGHHKEDVAETLLINLMRGTGLRGLCGIAPRNGHIVRPMLNVGRDEIEHFVKLAGETFVTDSTNNEPFCTRNKVRLQLMPLMKSVNPSVIDALTDTAARLDEARKVYDHSLNLWLSQLDQGANGIAISQLLALPSPESLLHQLLYPRGFNAKTIERIARCLTNPSGTTWQSLTHQLLISQGRLIIEPICPPTPPLIIPECGTYVTANGSRLRITIEEKAHISRSPETATLDANKLSFPLTLRPIAQGDRFTPFGMKGSCLVSDYLTNRKVNLFERRRTLVLTQSDGQIAWLVGHRTDQHFAIDAQTQRTITIEQLSAPEEKKVKILDKRVSQNRT